MQYLLPCSCGKKTEVGARAAGQSVQCACGRSLEVPTLRELALLEPAGHGEGEVQSPWSARQGVIFLGLVVAVAAFVASGVLYKKAHPSKPAAAAEVEQEIKDATDAIEKMPLGETHVLWWELQRRGLWRNESLDEKSTRETAQLFGNLMVACLILGAVGLMAAVGAWCIAPGRPSESVRGPVKNQS